MTTLVACDSAPSGPRPTADPNDPPVSQPTILALAAPTRTPLPSAVPAPSATPVPDPVVVPLEGPIDSLHPFYAFSPAARTVLGALFVGCVGQDETGRPVALGCESVPTAERGDAMFVGEGLDRHLQATFKIKAGWRWTDGKPVTGQDVTYAWQLAMSPEAGVRDAVLEQVFSMSVSGERAVVVNFMSASQAQAAAAGSLRGDVPFEYFSQLGDYARFTKRQAPLAPKDYWSAVRWLPAHVLTGVAPKDQPTSAFAKSPIGDGAFIIDTIDAEHIALKPAPQPFVLNGPTISGITFRIGSLKGVAEPYVPYVLSDVFAQDSSVAKGARIMTYTAAVEQLVLNVDRFPFNDMLVRQAVAHGLHRDALGQDPALTSVAPSSLTYDPAKAAALLVEAGWACDPKPCQKAVTDTAGKTITRTLSFKLTTTERQPRNVVAQAIQQQLAAIGFAVDVEIVFGVSSHSRLFARYEDGGVLLTRKFDAALYQIAAPLSVAGEFSCATIPTADSHDLSQGNASGFCDAEVDKLLAADEDGETVITFTHGKLLAEAISKIQQAAPVVPLYEVKRSELVQGISGLRPAIFLPVTWNAWEWK